MPLFSAIAFSAFILENQDFSPFALFNDGTVDNRIFQNGLSNLDIVSVRYH